MTDWQPSADIATLKQRAKILTSIRSFFAERDVLEVETPLLAKYSVTDPHMDVIRAEHPQGLDGHYFLQTSPEYAMKRLLAAGSGAIFQIGKAFRLGEQGSRHNPEFTMLEWYRPGFTDNELIEEIAELVEQVLGCQPCQRISYRALFQQYLSIDPHRADCQALEKLARDHLDVQMESDQRDDWLNLLLAEVIEPKLGADTPVFIEAYPASQSALARIAEDQYGNLVAQRFELYYRGVELANGYYELTDANELAHRFEQDRVLRQKLQRPDRESDQYLLAAMAQGLPDCAGVALGVDRLVMMALGLDRIEQVLSFGIANS
jgi:lysyl-tRNA synthetase class 2